MTTVRRPAAATWMAAGLLIALAAQLTLAASRNSATFDEPAHIYAGHLQWTKGWYTLNPPLTRYLMAAPLIGMDLKEPPVQQLPIRAHEMRGGRAFVFGNDADAILFRARMAIVGLAVVMAAGVFLAVSRMFSPWAGVIALAMLAFDPTLLAHSSLATTDTGQAALMFWAVYAFYAYVRRPTMWRVVSVGLVAGLALAAKSSAVLLFPMLALLAVIEIAWGERLGIDDVAETRAQRAGRLAMVLALTGLLAVAVLWGSYGFRYIPVDGGVPLVPAMEAKLATVPSVLQARMLATADRLHLLPRPYTYGFAHFLYEARAFTSYVLGTTYPHAVWFFFPIATVIKSTLTFLVLLGVGLWAALTGRVPQRRELLYVAVPAAIYMAFAIQGGMNIGIRHILPVFVFAAAFIGASSWALIDRDRRWRPVVAVLLVVQAVSVVRAFPGYVAYGNELFGGPANVHKYLSDSSSDWGQQLKSTKQYLADRGITDCWFAYFAEGPVDGSYYGLPCKPLPSALRLALGTATDVPPAIDGTVLISACPLAGFEFGPPDMAPYESFKSMTPVDIIDGGVLVYRGHFEIPLASALSLTHKASIRLRDGDAPGAVGDAERARALAPDSAKVMAMLGQALAANHEPVRAAEANRAALALAEAKHPEFQAALMADLRLRLGMAGR